MINVLEFYLINIFTTINGKWCLANGRKQLEAERDRKKERGRGGREEGDAECSK